MPVPTELLDLVARFREQHADYKRGAYNETQLRRDFLDPLFGLLGWDVDNRAGYAESFREVVHEDAVKVGGMTKAPDYSFRIGGRRLFFLEAKKPAVHIKEDIAPAYQLRRYAWSAGLQLSILSDFEEFAVYDGSIKPDPKDKSSKARIFYCTFEEYADKWDEIAALFSKNAVLKGGIERFVKKLPGRRGTATVDAEFLAQIESWRDLLARNIALRNDGIEVQVLNHAVQATIDRIVFLRISEDRGIEHEGRLLALTNGAGIYPRLTRLFRDADDRYNSGLFHFEAEKGRAGEPDACTLNLVIDDKPLKDIIRGLYYPESPYEFAVLPADILGQVYERFLGKVIRLTAGGQAKVEEKPEVKKAGGVYYTPTYIVEYIVRQTVGALLEGKTPKQAEKLRICDPACGSGSFLIGAYQHLLDWHLKWYSENEPQKHASGKNPKLRQSHDGWRLTVAERKRILINSIYGVDIDAQAVEVTKLSLLLKVLEGETGETLGLAQMKLFHERALPNLDANILCGNSLIGTDFYSGRLDLDEEERRRINTFDWEAGFPHIFPSVSGRGARGEGAGFDAVIGNPPYVRMESFKELKAYLKNAYACHDERSDLYAYFIERSHKLLGRDGRLGMIVSNKFLRANYGKPLRDFLVRNATLVQIADFAGLPVFKGATVRTLVIIAGRGQHQKTPLLYSPPPPVEVFEAIAGGASNVQEATERLSYEVPAEALNKAVWSFDASHIDDLMAKLQTEFVPLSDYCEGQICMGIKSGYAEAFVIDHKTREALVRQNRRAAEIIKPFLNGRDVRRYFIDEPDLYLIYTYHGIDMSPYPAVVEHLKPYKQRLIARATKQEWYELQQPQFNFSEWMGGPKIIFPDIAVTPRFALDETGHFSSNTTYFIPRRDLYLLGLLNSKLGEFYFKRTCAGLEGKNETYLRFFGQYLKGFPVAVIDTENAADRARHDKMVKLVESMLKLHEQLAAAKTAHDKILIQRQIDATDRQIDALVYELYGLTDEEIRIVEAGKAPA